MPFTPATVTVNTTNQTLVFNSSGYYIVGDEGWQDITYTAVIQYNGGTIGIVPRLYHADMYMTLALQNMDDQTDPNAITGYASLDVQVGMDLVNIHKANIPALVVGRNYTIKTEIYRTNYKIYIDGDMIMNVEYAGMARGRVGIYATTGNKATSIQVDSLFPDGWTTNLNLVTGAIVDIQELPNEDKFIYMNNPTTTALEVEQSIPVVGGNSHTISFRAMGTGNVSIIEVGPTTPKTFTYNVDSPTEWDLFFYTHQLSAGTTSVRMILSTVTSVLRVNEIQYEKKKFRTEYIDNDDIVDGATRDNSLITYPSKNNINELRGTVSMYIKPVVTYTNSGFNPVFFEYGDSTGVIQLRYDGTLNKLYFKYGTRTVNATFNLDKDKWYHITGSWSSSQIRVVVNDTYRQSANGDFSTLGSSEIIRFGHSYNTSYDVFNGVIDETIVYSDFIKDEAITELYTASEPVLNKSSMLMRATFNYAIGNFNKTHVEMTLAPKYGSPVVVEKQSGTPMQKVSFFDWETGEYRTWNEEEVLYDKMFDYVKVSFSDLDTESFKILVRDKDLNIIGDPYVVDGRRIYLNLNEEQKKDLHNRRIYVMYQVANAFTVDFNIGVPDSFRVNIGKYDGEPVKITYEGNDFQDEKLATMIELNPLLNPNHEGFLYITKNTEKVTSFRVRVTPEDLPADGVSEALVVIEPMDANGNYISHAKLDIQAGSGKMIPNFDKGSVLARERAGRYLYQYRAPLIHQKESKTLEVEDYINVIDPETGLGVQVPITLTAVQIITHVIDEDDTPESVALTYGSTVKDIVSTNGFSKSSELQNFMDTNIGGGVKIPLNYLGSILRKTYHGSDEEAYEDMAILLFDEIMNNMGKLSKDLPAGLADIIDTDADGKIDMNEIDWLERNLYNSAMIKKSEALQAWYKVN